MNPDWLGAFLIGVVGAGHCMGMCGGIAGMLTMGSSPNKPFVVLFYNIGRLISYSVMGAIIGGAIAGLADVSQANHALVWLRLAAALFMVLLALYIGRWWTGLLAVEKLGQKLWKVISPAGKSFLPLKSSLHALPFGFIWGWLPCGLVYSTLTWAAVSGSAINGAGIMLAFGLGTLPAMLLIGYGARFLHTLQQSVSFRNIAAILLLAYGLYTAYDALILLSLN
ncbi:sulfite exporter TauE/SafE family protein [Vibrio sonorensis]|uniref:sulfite exporter TauE/SafE family protein n=1 Tax=Vibrio sonorensis TaxID=1004316 RepID=UPI0008DA00F7|nr:sulfite exporter TauE/SafE family protein [Vibrio sonorensis]